MLSNITNLFCSDCVRAMPDWDFRIWLVITVLATLFSLKYCHRSFNERA